MVIDLKIYVFLNYRKDSIKRPGGYLTSTNFWEGTKSRGGRLIEGGAYFIEREFNGILIFIYIFQVFVNQYKRY